MTSPEVICVGEPLVAFVAEQPGPLRVAERFSAHVTGAEVNTAIGLSRLGISTAFVGRRGADALGARIERELRAEGVISTSLLVDADAPTGLLIRNTGPFGVSEVIYRRCGSAGSRLDVDDIRAAKDLFNGAKWLHLSGITSAISDSGREALESAVELASECGVEISVDANIRRSLASLERQRESLAVLAEKATLFLCGAGEAEALTGQGDLDVAMSQLSAWGPEWIVIKRGSDGAVALGRNGERYAAEGRDVSGVVDRVGAGDAFAAGVLASLVRDKGLPAAIDVGGVVAACAISVLGDSAGLPDMSEVQQLQKSDGYKIVR